MKIPSLVAHRGWASRYPENTAVGIEAALDAGVPYVEFDVQLSADAVPVVIHDADLARTAGISGRVREMTWRELREVSVHEPARLGARFEGTRISSLAMVAAMLARWPGAGAFVEIKRESAEAHGVDDTVALVVDALSPVLDRSVVISFVERAVLSARRLGAPAVGWVLNYYDSDSRRLAEAMAPDFLLCDQRKLPPPPASPWPGPWRWMVYEIDDARQALELARRGIDMVESMAAGDLIRDPVFGAVKLPA